MTGRSRRLYTGALNYVLHSQIVVTEAFHRHRADRQPQGRSHYQVRLLQVHLCDSKKKREKNSVTTTTRTDGIQSRIKISSNSHVLIRRNTFLEKALRYVAFLYCVFTCLQFTSLEVKLPQVCLFTAWDPDCPTRRLNHFPH